MVLLADEEKFRIETPDEEDEEEDDEFVSKDIEDASEEDFDEEAKALTSAMKRKRSKRIPIPMDLLEHKTSKPTSGDIHGRMVVIQKTLENFGIDVEMGEKDIVDIFRLDEDMLKSLERMGPKSAANIMEAIAKSKQITLARFIYALGIRHVGEHVAGVLAESYGSLEKVTNATTDNLIAIDGVGPVVAESIAGFFEQQRNRNTAGARRRMLLSVALHCMKSTASAPLRSSPLLDGRCRSGTPA